MTTAKDVERQTKKMFSNGRDALPTLDHIKDDIDSLQTAVACLAKDLKAVSAGKVNGAVDYVNDQIDTLKNTGAEVLEKVEGQIKSQPARSITIALAVGILASYLLGRKSS